MRFPRRSQRAALAVFFATAFFASPALAAPSTDLLDVVQIGTGSAALTSGATATSIVPLLGTGGTGTAIPLPTAQSTANGTTQYPFASSGTATSEGALALSQDGKYLTVAGYDTTPGNPATSVNGTTSAATPRVIARIDGAGNVDTSTALKDAFSTSNVRGVVETTSGAFYVTGDGGSVTSGSTKNAGIVYVSGVGASASAGVTTAPKQARSVVIANGNLYLSTSKSPGPGVFQVGSGLPVGTGATVPTTTIEGSASVDPYGFALVRSDGTSGAPDTLYVADGTTGGIVKYGLSGGTWTLAGQIAGVPLGSLTAKVVSPGVTHVYATTLDGGSVLSLTDSSTTPTTFTPSAFTTIATAPGNTVFRGIALAPTGQVAPAPPTPAPTVTFSDTALGATIGDSNNPTITTTVGDGAFTADQLTLTASSSNQAVVPDSAITLTGTGANRTVSVAPVGVGTATITITAKTPDGVVGSGHFQYGASAAAIDTTSRYFYGAADASSEINVGGGYVIAADDENSTLRLYRLDRSGLPVKTWNYATQAGTASELDLEWAARRGNTIVWGGSESNTKTGDLRPSDSTVFSTTITGSGASTDLTFTGVTTTLRNDLIAWDTANGSPLGLATAGAQGANPKLNTGYNIEGMEFGPNGSSTAYLGFRAPTESPTSRTLALVVPVTNLLDLLSGAATHATFGPALQWDLGGQGIREIRKNASDQYLVLAGDSAGGGTQHLYTWDGNPADQPVATGSVLPAPATIDGAWEGIAAMPDTLTDGATISLVQDNGDTVFYGGTATGKDVAVGLQKDWADDVTLKLPSQAIAFDSTAPSGAFVGDTYAVAAHGGASGNPVVFSIDSASDSGACTINGAQVALTGPGTCIVDAKQAGTFQYTAAPTAQQTFSVSALQSQAITFDTAVPSPAFVGDTYAPAAHGGASGKPVVITIDPLSDPGVCSLQASGAVSFDAAGRCLVDADQAAARGFSAATTVQQAITITRKSQTIAFDSTVPSPAFVGDGYTPVAHGGASGSPVTFSIDGSSDAGACSISSGVVSLTGAGSCVIDADQGGTTLYDPAKTAQQSISVSALQSQAITFDTAVPSPAFVGDTYAPAAHGGTSGKPVVITIDPLSDPGVCSLQASGAVSFDAAGRCLVDADQAAARGFSAATTVQQTITITRKSQTITFDTTAPSPAYVGGSYTPAAHGGASGKPLVFSIDAASTAGACSLKPTGAVSFDGAGTCVIDADQASTTQYDAAKTAQQSITVSALQSQAITFDTAVPSPANVGGTYAPAAHGGASGKPVVFSIDATSDAGACSLQASGAVSFDAAGSCVIDADQAAAPGYSAAATAQQKITITRKAQAITFDSTVPSPAYVSASYTPAAHGGASGNPVVFSIDAASTAGACSLKPTGAVSFDAAGTCIVDADQAATTQYDAAKTAQQTITITKPAAPTVVPTITGTLGSSGWYISNVTVSWQVTSPVPAAGCASTTITADTTGQVVTCSTTTAGGTTSQSVTIKRDTAAPVIAFSGNAGTYGLLDTVNIGCTATDPAPGSGLLAQLCPGVSGPAWSFGPGAHTLSANATDNAGNRGFATTTFTVTVTPAALCTLTDQFVQGSAKYKALGLLSRALTDLLVTADCRLLTQIGPALRPADKATLITAYQQSAAALATAGWITSAQSSTLVQFSAVL